MNEAGTKDEMKEEESLDTTGLSIYEYASCPFCARVRSFLAQAGLEVELRDILENADYRRELGEATGRTMVPCLRIEEGGSVQWMHESADIVAYLRDRFDV